jgi:beta-1,4-mannooligosaccharide/beta-1,4-mannosyl-N-acetylglucosamine phosphorylase
MKRSLDHDVLTRYAGNPIIAAGDIPFTCNTVFNGSPIKIGDAYHMLLRVEGQHGYSLFALAHSTDGRSFTVEDLPVAAPVGEGPFARYEEAGIEDPRITLLEGTIYIVYTAFSGAGPVMMLARTTDFHDLERIAVISEPGNKDGMLFPRKIGGRYVRFDRPIGNGIGSIWVSFSDDLLHWGCSRAIICPRSGHWDSYRVGASAVPIETDQGWLEIYHGVRMTSAGPIYRAGVAMLDLDDPTRLIGRSPEPILSPRAEYERIGDIGNVVFASGAIVEPDGMVKVYYGAADTAICLAEAPLEELIDVAMSGAV